MSKNRFIPQFSKKIKDNKIKNSVQEIGGDFLIENKGKKGLSFSSKNITRLFLVFFIGLSILLIRSFYLQITKGDYYRNLAEGNRIRIQTIEANRGIIYDRNKKQLTKNIPNFFLEIVPADLPEEKKEKETVIRKLGQLVGSSPEEIGDKLKDVSPYSYQPIILENFLDYEKAILAKIETDRLPGVNLNFRQSRQYLYPQSTSHFLGYLGKINKKEYQEKKADYDFNSYLGRSGLELFYENLLKGQDGKERVEVNAFGKKEKVVSRKDPLPGKSLVLTIDIDLQNKLTEITESFLKRSGFKRGAVIVLNPQNGEVLALNSFPTYDNNKFIHGLSEKEYEEIFRDPNQPLFSRFISGEYPPGSTIKPLIALGALEEGVITSSTIINSRGGIRIDKWFYPDWKTGGHGMTNVTKAIAESVNTFFYYIGGGYKEFKGLGVRKIKEYLSLFGLNKKTGIDLPGEKDGFLPSPQWKERISKEVIHRYYFFLFTKYHRKISLAIGKAEMSPPLPFSTKTVTTISG